MAAMGQEYSEKCFMSTHHLLCMVHWWVLVCSGPASRLEVGISPLKEVVTWVLTGSNGSLPIYTFKFPRCD
jgi:hypothetical protein